MRLRRLINERLEHEGEGLSVRAAINAMVVANVNEPESDAQAPQDGPDEADAQNKIKEVPDD